MITNNEKHKVAAGSLGEKMMSTADKSVKIQGSTGPMSLYVTEGSLKHIPEAAADSSPQGKEENERFSQKQENRNENTFQAAQSLLGQ